MIDRRSTKKVITAYAKPDRVIVPLFLFLAAVGVWLLSLELVIGSTTFLAKLSGAVLLGATTVRLFIIGHDACHGSYVANPQLNKLIARVAFLPSLTPFSLWEVGHNVVHHAYTNYRRLDYVWAPFSPQEFAALTPTRQLLEHIYRSGFGAGLYHLLEIWWKRLFFPSKKHLPGLRRAFFWDNLLVTSFAAAWIGALVWSAFVFDQSVGATLLCGFILPWLFFVHAFGIAIYLQHTHPAIKWYDDKKRWSEERGYITTSTQLVMPWPLGPLLLNVMDHTAHHVDMSVPFNRLPAAQGALNNEFPKFIVVQKFSWRWYLAASRTCQLYDYDNQKWTPFSDAKRVATLAPLAGEPCVGIAA